MAAPVRVTVWNEFVHERLEREPNRARELYPDGIHATLRDGLRRLSGDRVAVSTATLEEPEAGLSAEVLAGTDVLVWWGHVRHEQVPDDVVDRVCGRVLAGMGLVVLHSGHASRVFRRLTGTTCTLAWRHSHDTELVWTLRPDHPIAAGVPQPLVIPMHETYSEPFDIPTPDELVFVSGFSGGEVFRSGCLYRRGLGTIFYFSPGDQSYPVYHQDEVIRVIANAVDHVAPRRPVGEPPTGAARIPSWLPDAVRA